MAPITTIGTAVLAIMAMGLNYAKAQSLNDECYRMVEGRQQATSPGGGPCGIISSDTGFTSCCAVGDQCVEGGLCHFTHESNPEWHQSGYYLGGCTDPSLKDSSCNLGCKDLAVADVTFDVKAKKWLCCGSDSTGNITCNDPTTSTVAAKAIASLATTYVVPSTVHTTSASSKTSSTSSTSTSSASSTSSTPSTSTSDTAASRTETEKSSGGTTNAGAITGGVVGGVALIAIAIGVWFWYRWWHDRNAALQAGGGLPGYELAVGEGHYAPLGKPLQGGRPELDSAVPSPSATEMDGRNVRQNQGVAEMP